VADLYIFGREMGICKIDYMDEIENNRVLVYFEKEKGVIVCREDRWRHRRRISMG
jgi:hypothetical protein